MREGFLECVRVAADDADEGPLLTAGKLGLESDLVYAVDHRVDLSLGRGVSHDDDHGLSDPLK